MKNVGLNRSIDGALVNPSKQSKSLRDHKKNENQISAWFVINAAIFKNPPEDFRTRLRSNISYKPRRFVASARRLLSSTANQREAGQRTDTSRTDPSTDRLPNGIRPETTTSFDRKSVATGRFGLLCLSIKFSMMPSREGSQIFRVGWIPRVDLFYILRNIPLSKVYNGYKWD